MLHDLIESSLSVDELFYMGKYAFGKNENRWWLNVKYFSDLEKKYITFCYDTLRDVSRSFYGVIMEIPQILSLDVAIFYLVLRALDTVEDDITSFQGSKEARAEYLRNFYKSFTPLTDVGEPKYRPLMQNYDRVGSVFKLLKKESQKVILDITKRMGEGMSEFVLKDYNIVTLDDYNSYCNTAAGLVGEGMMKLSIINGYENEDLIQALLKEQKHYFHKFGGLEKSMGLFLQKTNIIRDYKEDIECDKSWWPKDVWSKYKKNFKDMGDDDESKNCLNEMILDALELVPDILVFHEKLTDSKVLRFCVTPQIVAIATLEKCFDNSDVFKRNLRIRKGLALKIMETSRSIEDMYLWLRTFIISIKNKIRHNDPNKARLIEVCDKILMIIHKKYTPPLLSTNMKLVLLIAFTLIISCVVIYYGLRFIIKPFFIDLMIKFITLIHTYYNNINTNSK